jgi:hypothetical protein
MRKSNTQLVREMTDAGYRPKEIYEKLNGKMKVESIYVARSHYRAAIKQPTKPIMKKSKSQKIRELTDAGYRPREIFAKLNGEVSLGIIYKVRHAHRFSQKRACALEAAATLGTPGYTFDLAEPDRPSLWMRIKRWLLGEKE